MRTYFVIGATGRTGGHIVDALRRQGHGVCGTYRTEQGRSKLESLGARSAPFDLTTGSEADLAQLMTGSDGVVFAAGSPNQCDANRVDRDGAVA